MLITVGGVSRAGKSTLALLLAHLLGRSRSAILSQDKFPMPRQEIPLVGSIPDWEVPSSLDLKSFWETVVEHQNQCDFVIAEGLFIHFGEGAPPIDVCIHIDIPHSVFVDRRTQDDRWGKDEPWYIEHVWESHFRYGLPPADAIRLLGTLPFPLIAVLHKILSKYH